MDYKQKIEEKRQKIVDTLIEFIESNPAQWEAGWYSVPNETPWNGKTQKKYNGVNAFYLCVLGAMRGYKDPRWVTFNQAKELGANVKAGAKSSEVSYWSKYDKKTKQPFDEKTCDGMTFEEAQAYKDENVRPVIKFYQVFNAEQCENMPEYERTTSTPEMEAEERRRQNAIIEQIISNSAAPVSYDGGNRAYYSPTSDSIHLPEIKDFKTMQDYYATALHEISHSTGHESRLSRNMSGLFGTPDYAKEELRAELASVFMQLEFGISVEGKHFDNHGAYLASWLKSVKDNKNVFFSAASDAEKITNYVADNYAHELELSDQNEHKENKQEAEPIIENASVFEQDIEPKFEANTSFAKQVDAVLSGADTTSTHLKVMGTPLILRQLGAKNLPVLMTAKHLKTIVAESGEDTNTNYHGLDTDLVKKLPELLADPVMVMDSLTRDDGIVVLTSAVDKENRPIIGAIKFDGYGRLSGEIIKANILLSVYGRNNFTEFIKRNQETGNILYWNKEKSQELSVNPRVQFPDVMASLDSNIIIRKSKAFVNSLEEKNKNNVENDEENKANKENDNADKAFVVNTNPQMANNRQMHNDYMKTQEKYPNAIVLTRLGDFYEVLGDNASKIAKQLDLTLTGRDLGLSERVPMCGFPFHAADEYISKIRANGDVVVKNADNEEIFRKSPLTIKSQVDDWSDWSTETIKNKEAREAAEWLILNNYEDENDVKQVFYDRQTSSMSDDFNAEFNDEAAIIKVANEYQKIQAAEKEAIEKAREAAHAAGLPFSDKFHNEDEDFNPYVYDGSMSVEDYNLMHSHIAADEQKKAAALEQERYEQVQDDAVYGIIYNWKGLKEENSLYKESELALLDEKYMYGDMTYDGAFAANKTFSAWKLSKSNESDTLSNIKDFLTGKYNDDSISNNYWYWETVDTNLFTGKKNETTLYYINRLNLSDKDLSMQDEYETQRDETTATVVEQARPVEQVQQVEKSENTKEKYTIDLQLSYSNEMLLSNELKKLGYNRDNSLYETNEARDVAAFDARTPFWLNEIRYKGQDGKIISGLYGRTSNGILIEATDISRFTLDNLSREEAEQFLSVLREFGIEATFKEQAEQAEQDNTGKPVKPVVQAEQAEQAEQVRQVGQAKWNKIPLDTALIGAERGKSTQFKMPGGEYSSFVFFAPTKFVQRDEKTGAVQLSVNDDFKYTLMRGNQRVELIGSELRQAMAGQGVGKRAQRSLSEANAQTLSDIYRNVPAEMRQYPNWCVFTTRWNEEKGKKDKLIFSPVLGLNKDGKMQWASIDKPETWATFDAAMRFAEENDCAGLVYALDGKSGISCIDLDKSIVLNGKLNDKPTDRKEGEMSALAARLSEDLRETYIETSASGNGIHIFVKDDLLAKGKYKNRAETPDGEIEVYDEKRFMSMTGNLRSNTQRLGISPVLTTAFLQEKLGVKIAEIKNTVQPRQARQIDKSDSAVIERIRRSRKGAEFDELYSGVNVTGDNSRTDFKLLNMLAFFTDCDEGQMERIFRDSALYRAEKGEQYVRRSVSKACSTLQTRMSDHAFNSERNNNGGRGNSK